MAMASVFWTLHGIIFIDCPENRRTVTEAHNSLLFARSNDEIMEKWPHTAKQKSADISPVQTGTMATGKIVE